MEFKDVILMLFGVLGTIGFSLSSWALLRVVALTSKVAVLENQLVNTGDQIRSIDGKVDRILSLLMEPHRRN